MIYPILDVAAPGTMIALLGGALLVIALVVALLVFAIIFIVRKIRKSKAGNKEITETSHSGDSVERK